MASNVFGSKKFNPTAPEKGSFPLDRDGECKKFYAKYMICLVDTHNNASACREASKDYLGCRMEKGLMTKESWQKLGYADLVKEDPHH
jgi:cytochrome c oxidase assembly protein subunit 19